MSPTRTVFHCARVDSSGITFEREQQEGQNMASSKMYLDFILDQLSEVDSRTYLAKLIPIMYDDLPEPKKRAASVI